MEKATNLTRIAISLALITILAPSATDMYLPSMPVIEKYMGVDYAKIQLSLTVFLLAQGIGQVFLGPVIDRYGRKIPLLTGLAVFIISSLWAGSSSSLESLVAARFIQGFSGALLLVIGFSSVRDVAEGPAAARLFAVLLTIEGLAPVFAPLAGGYIGEYLGWRAVLYTSAIMGAVALVNSCYSLPETLPKEKRIPLQPKTIITTYKRILCDSNFLLPTLGLSGVFFFLFAYISGAPYLYQDIYGLSSDKVGTMIGMTGISVMLGAFTTGRLTRKFSISSIAVGGLLFAILGTAISFMLAPSLGYPGIAGGFFIALYGVGISESSLVSLSMSSQKTALGSTAALMGALHLALSSLSTPITGILLPMSITYWFIFLLLSLAVTLSLVFWHARKVRMTIPTNEVLA